MDILKRSSQRTILLVTSLLAASLSAQTAQPTKTEPAASDEVIELSPFTVTTDRDYGYRASNSIAGTRSNTPIKDISLNIQVFTKDLADDLMLNDQTSLERYNAALTNGGADVQSDNNIQQAYNAFLFRGFIQNWGLRDGVRQYDPVDSQGLARVEIVKGPAAALYGVSYPGGLMNSISKQVDMRKEFTSTRFSGDSQGGYRATIDANFVGNVAGGKFGVRFNGTNGISEDKREHSKGNLRLSQVNLEFQPASGTQIQFLAQTGWRQKPNGLGYYTMSVGSAQIPLQVVHPEIPWTWNWASDNMRSLETSLYRASITQKIGDNFNVNVYMQSSTRRNIDSNGWDDGGNSQNGAGWDTTFSSNGAPPTGWINPGAGAAGGEKIRRIFHYRDWNNANHALGATAVYKLDLGPTKNTFTTGVANWDERFYSHKFTQPGTTTNFFDLPVKAGINTLGSAGAPVDYFQDAAGDSGREHSQNIYYFGTWNFSALDNRLKLNAGLNSTKIKDLQWSTTASTNHNGLVDISKTSPMFGGMFDITKEVSVFAVRSSSLFPNTTKNDFGVQLPSIVGTSNEVGVKLEVLDGMISGTVSYYKIVQEGGNQRDPSAINRNKLAWDSYTTAQRALYFPGITDRNQLNDQTGNPGDQVAGAEQESKGYEADLVFQPTKSLQIVLSYAHNTAVVTKAINIATIGQSSSGHIKDQYSVLAKYTFNNGAAKGLFLGLGTQSAGKALQDYQTSGSTTIVRYNPSTFYVEGFAGYKFKAFGVNQSVQLNAKNLTKQDDFIGWKPNGANIATERYSVPTYAKVTLTWGLDF